MYLQAMRDRDNVVLPSCCFAGRAASTRSLLSIPEMSDIGVERRQCHVNRTLRIECSENKVSNKVLIRIESLLIKLLRKLAGLAMTRQM